jgi:predicted transglutaminase-like protease
LGGFQGQFRSSKQYNFKEEPADISIMIENTQNETDMSTGTAITLQTLADEIKTD